MNKYKYGVAKEGYGGETVEMTVEVTNYNKLHRTQIFINPVVGRFNRDEWYVYIEPVFPHDIAVPVEQDETSWIFVDIFNPALNDKRWAEFAKMIKKYHGVELTEADRPKKKI